MHSAIKNLLRVILCFSTLHSYAESTQTETGVQSLSGDLRVLLQEEMRAIQEGMVAIIPAYSAGDSREIANIARQIQNSYVLKQNITPAQKQELSSKLPPKFLMLDKQFHTNAEKLAEAAEARSQDKIGFYFSQMSEACAGCHAQFATHKFPFLLESAETP